MAEGIELAASYIGAVHSSHSDQNEFMIKVGRRGNLIWADREYYLLINHALVL